MRCDLAATLGFCGPPEITDANELEAKRFAGTYNLEGAFPVLMFAGPLEYSEKVAGVVELIKAFRGLLGTYPKAKLLIVGDGTLRNRVEAASEDLRGSLTITGFLDDIRPALVNADIYCHISRQEGLPTALLEAMSLGRCVVASRVGGIPEVLDGSNGCLVETDALRIQSMIHELLEDESRRRILGDAARRTIERDYTWTARLPQISSIYGLAG